MTVSEKINMVKNLTGETDTDVLSAYLFLAGNVVLQKAFPLGNAPEDVPSRYDGVHVEIAVYLINKRGAEGEVAHSENGISRTYENGDIPANLLRRIIPCVEVI